MMKSIYGIIVYKDTMQNKIYYGEYTLQHWIKLMLTGNIVLPQYQRHFVWKERDVKRLLQSLKEGQFVQPVTIALYADGSKKENLILDGQQRLTSLLLAYIGYIPDTKKFETDNGERVATEDDSALDEENTSTDGILWQYTELLKYGKTKMDILSKVQTDDRYIQLADDVLADLDDKFFKNTYLGFSYVVPVSNDATTIQNNFSQLFRNINYFGKKLDPMESRKSLYYQNADLTDYFEGKCEDGTSVLSTLKIMEGIKLSKIDFVRYLTILSQFSFSRPGAIDVLVGYSAYASRESCYADYVSYLLGLDQEDRVKKFNGFKFSDQFPNTNWKERFKSVKDSVERLKPIMSLNDKEAFSACYEADIWLFGLLYHILFYGKTLNDSLDTDNNGNAVSLEHNIKAFIESARNDKSFLKNANRLGNIRMRLVKSCEIYSNYVH